jgi:hypothetical protein
MSPPHDWDEMLRAQGIERMVNFNPFNLPLDQLDRIQEPWTRPSKRPKPEGE